MDEPRGRPLEVWQRLGGAWVRGLELAPAAAPRGTALLLPGLGLPSYTRRAAWAVSRLGLRCVVLDVLAGWRVGRRLPAQVDPVAAAAAAWAGRCADPGPLVLVGHSTGSQAALAAAVRLQGSRPLAVVLAGLTFRPEHRTVRGLARGAATAYRRDSLREMVVLRDLARVRSDVVRLVRSAQSDRPEDRVRELRAPLVLTAGEGDTFATQAWLGQVAGAAGGPASVVRLPGSHNNVFTHPEAFAAEVERAAAAARPV